MSVRPIFLYEIKNIHDGRYYFGTSVSAMKRHYTGGGVTMSAIRSSYANLDAFYADWKKRIIGTTYDNDIAIEVERNILTAAVGDPMCMNRCPAAAGRISEERAAKRAAKLIGYTHTEEAKKQIGSKTRHNKLSDEARAKIGAYRTG